MKNILSFLIVLFFATASNAQVISRFTWDSNTTTAVAGANAISVSSTAVVMTGGKNGSNGISPGLGSNDINLVLDGACFNVPALDISIDFRREESQASFFYRGSYFDFGMNGGNLSAIFRLASGSTYTTINSGEVFSIPNDHNFHNYHFNYDNNAGVAKIWVDNVLVYTYTGIAGTALYWTGAGNVTIGRAMDATGKNVAVMDNLVIQMQANALLPLTLVGFTAETKSNYAQLAWKTTKEVAVASFIVERSSNGASFTAVASIDPSNGFSGINNYLFTDSLPFTTVSYYRLKMVNQNGSFTYSAIKTVSFTSNIKAEMSVFPNPATDYVIIKMNNGRAAQYHYTVTSISGQVISAAAVQVNGGANQLQIDLTRTNVKGAIVITLVNTQANTTETFTIIKK